MSVFIPKGVNVRSLDDVKKWQFTPRNKKVGDLIGAGDA